MAANTIKVPEKKNTKFVAHRGCSGLETENTAAAFLAAAHRTYFGIETDIYRTADGQFICSHDNHTARICEQDLYIEQSTLAELRALTLKDRDGQSDRAELMLCTPYEYVKICKKYGKHPVPELKSNFTREEIEALLQIFADAEMLDDTTFIAFNMDNLDHVRAVRPQQTVQFLISKWNDELPAMLSERKMGLDIHYTQLTAERVQLLHENGIEVNCWTVDKPEEAEAIIAMGADQITTNILE